MTQHNLEQHRPERVTDTHHTSQRMHEDSYSNMIGRLKSPKLSETTATHLDFGPAPYPDNVQAQIIILPISGVDAPARPTPPIPIGSEAAATTDSTSSQNKVIDINAGNR